MAVTFGWGLTLCKRARSSIAKEYVFLINECPSFVVLYVRQALDSTWSWAVLSRAAESTRFNRLRLRLFKSDSDSKSDSGCLDNTSIRRQHKVSMQSVCTAQFSCSSQIRCEASPILHEERSS